MVIKVDYSVSPIYINTSISPIYITVDYGTGGGGGGTWGTITGTLSDQVDLQAALDDKVPYTGATADVNLGEYEIKAGQVTLDVSPTGTAAVGTTRWNDTIGSSETTLKGGSVILKNGVDLVARVVNKVTPNTTLTKAAYQAVRITGAQGQRLAVAFAQANNDINSADTIGLVTETIANNQEGFIITVGNLENINTTGSLQGETWTDGDVLYLSPTIAGVITNVKPLAPQHLVIIGYVEYAHPNNGKIYVKVMNGWELGELHDVNTAGATNGQVLKYNGSIWTPSSDIDTGITSLNGLTALTQTFATGSTGTDFNISSATSTHTFNIPTASATNRGLLSSADWSTFNGKQNTITLTTTGTSGAATLIGSTLNIPQYSGTNIYNSDGTLTGNRTVTNNAFTLTIVNASNTSAPLILQNTQPYGTGSVFNQYAQQWLKSNGTNAGYVLGDIGRLAMANAVQAPEILVGAPSGIIDAGTQRGGGIGINGAPINFGTATYAQGGTNIGRWFSTGNLLIQTGGTFTDAGYKLMVEGTGRFTGNVTISNAGLYVTSPDGYSGGAIEAQNNMVGASTIQIKRADITNALGILQFSDLKTGASVRSFTIGIGRSGDPQWTNGDFIFAFYKGSGGWEQNAKIFNATGNWAIENGSATSDIASALLQVNSTTKGFLPPRMTTAQRDLISTPATGLSIYNTTLNTNDFYNGTAWVSQAAGNIYTADGTLTGNRTVTMGSNTLTFSGDIFVSTAFRVGRGAGNVATNTALGQETMQSITTGTHNVGVGYAALRSSTNNSYNTAVGYASQYYSNGGGQNSSLGYQALFNVITGSYNVAVGNQALQSSTESFNTSIGSQSLLNLTTGQSNIAIGNSAGRFISGGSVNLTSVSESIIIGNNAKILANGNTNQIVIGTNAVGLGSNTTVIGNSSTTDTAIYGRMLVNYGTPVIGTYALDVQGTGRFTGDVTFGNATQGKITAPTGATIRFVGGSAPVGVELPYVLGAKDATGFLHADNSYFIETKILGWNGYGVGIKNGITKTDISGVASAIFSISSTTQGFLPPRMTTAQKNAIGTPAAGLVVYDTDTNKLCCYNGSTWNDLF